MTIAMSEQLSAAHPVAGQGSCWTLWCTARWHETTDVVSFRFKAADQSVFSFKPGQFITFQVSIDGVGYARSYTISSSPTRPDSLMVTIKRVAGGKVSNYLCDNLQPGHSVQVLGPFGDFNLIDKPAARYLFLSAGCGITPMYSMSRYLTDSIGNAADICFIHSARTLEDVIFRESLLAMAEHNDGFRIGLLLRRIPNGNIPANVTLQSGYLDPAALQQLVPDLAQRTVYVCGPERFMSDCAALFRQLDFDMDRFHQERFTAAANVNIANVAAANHTLCVDGKATPLSSTQTLLEGIEAMALPIIAACRSGVCGACKCQVVAGQVSSTSQQTLTPAELAQGMVLACSTHALSDVQLRLGR